MWTALINLAGGRGFEPRLTVPETAVLPLDEPPELVDGYFTMWGGDRQTSMDVRGCVSRNFLKVVLPT